MRRSEIALPFKQRFISLSCEKPSDLYNECRGGGFHLWFNGLSGWRAVNTKIRWRVCATALSSCRVLSCTLVPITKGICLWNGLNKQQEILIRAWKVVLKHCMVWFNASRSQRLDLRSTINANIYLYSIVEPQKNKIGLHQEWKVQICLERLMSIT